MKLTKIIAIVVLLTMLLPFAAVSCEGEEVIKGNNVTLALGIDKSIEIYGEKEKIDLDIVFSALVVLILAIVGVVYFVKNTDENIMDNMVAMGIYGLLILFLLLLPKGVENMAIGTSEAAGYGLEVEMKIGYFLALISSIGMVGYSFMLFKKNK